MLPSRPHIHAIFLAAVALVPAACGGRVDGPPSTSSAVTTGGSPGSEPAACTPSASTGNPQEDCATYCGYQACTCNADLSACTASCQSATQQGEVAAACLACAVNEGPITGTPQACSPFVMNGTFTVTFRVPICESDCGP
jgi:hypothetical protein